MGRTSKKRFGSMRLLREDISWLHKLQWIFLGVADPGHYLRFYYFRKALNYLDFIPESILDVGCGSGDYTFYLAEKFKSSDKVGIDIDENRIKRNLSIQKKCNIRNTSFRVENAQEMNDDKCYDLIICIDVFEHMEDQDEVISCLHRKLKNGGYLYLHVPLERYKPVPFSHRMKEFNKWADEEHKGNLYNKKELTIIFKKNGFKIINQRFTFSYYAGELAVSLFNIFFKNNIFNNIAQALLIPVSRALCYLDSFFAREIGFGMSILAKRANESGN